MVKPSCNSPRAGTRNEIASASSWPSSTSLARPLHQTPQRPPNFSPTPPLLSSSSHTTSFTLTSTALFATVSPSFLNTLRSLLFSIFLVGTRRSQVAPESRSLLLGRKSSPSKLPVPFVLEGGYKTTRRWSLFFCFANLNFEVGSQCAFSFLFRFLSLEYTRKG